MDFFCHDNKLTSNFDCSNNQLTDLLDSCIEVAGYFNCSGQVDLVKRKKI